MWRVKGIFYNQEKKPLSELAKASVEALASGESSAGYFKATESTVVSSQETPYATIITTKTVTNCIPGGPTPCTSGTTYSTTRIPK